jgi:hypothetical protein
VAERFDAVELAGRGRPDEFRVLPCNWPAMQVFLRLRRQWRFAGLGGVVGLDYAQVLAALELMGVERPMWPDLFDKLRVMEEAAMEVIESRR